MLILIYHLKLFVSYLFHEETTVNFHFQCASYSSPKWDCQRHLNKISGVQSISKSSMQDPYDLITVSLHPDFCFLKFTYFLSFTFFTLTFFNFAFYIFCLNNFHCISNYRNYYSQFTWRNKASKGFAERPWFFSP